MANILLLIRRIHEARGDAVRFEAGGETRCPVCEAAGLPHLRVTVTSTVGMVRHCHCWQCFANFKAIGAAANSVKKTDALDKTKKRTYPKKRRTNNGRAKSRA